MYKINTGRTFTRDVTVVFPDPNKEGKDSKGVLTATFKELPQSEFDESLDLSDVEFLRKVLKKVSGIADESGNSIPEGEAIEGVLDDSCAVSAMLSEYLYCMKGKNFRNRRPR